MITNPYAIINEFRTKAPVDVEGLIKALGLKVCYVYSGNSISGSIEKQPDGSYLISVNADDPETRKRFTMAHELGHYILHRDKMGNGIQDNRMYRAINVGQSNLIRDKEESQANQFAANLLMPKELIESLQAEGITNVTELAKKLSVSNQAMQVRLEAL